MECPQCRRELVLVEQDKDSTLNQYQFNSVKAGDYYCTSCPGNDRGKENICYFWEYELGEEDYPSIEIIKCGQVAPYADSVYKYTILSDWSYGKVKRFCVDKVNKVQYENEIPGHNHNGHCRFPFGLSPFYTFVKVGDGKFSYTVTRPFCD